MIVISITISFNTQPRVARRVVSMKKTLSRAICLALVVCSPAAALAEQTDLSIVFDKDLLLMLIILFALLGFSYVSHEKRDQGKKNKG